MARAIARSSSRGTVEATDRSGAAGGSSSRRDRSRPTGRSGRPAGRGSEIPLSRRREMPARRGCRGPGTGRRGRSCPGFSAHHRRTGTPRPRQPACRSSRPPARRLSRVTTKRRSVTSGTTTAGSTTQADSPGSYPGASTTTQNALLFGSWAGVTYRPSGPVRISSTSSNANSFPTNCQLVQPGESKREPRRWPAAGRRCRAPGRRVPEPAVSAVGA